MTTSINSKSDFPVSADNFNINTFDTGFLDDKERTLFQIKKQLKRMAFIINRKEKLVIISGPKYDDEVHYDHEIMSVDRARNIWTLLTQEGWTRSR